MLNDPYAGGTHLPDVTLVTPVAVGGEIVGYTVSRAHHSDVGGMKPGSMPSESRSIYQEGIIIPPVRLVRRGELVEDLLELVLANVRTPEHPPRRPAGAGCRERGRRRAAAARSSSATGSRSFARRSTRCSPTPSAARARSSGELPDGTYTAEGEIEGDGVDDVDIPIRVAVTIDGDSMIVDFAGTSPVPCRATSTARSR